MAERSLIALSHPLGGLQQQSRSHHHSSQIQKNWKNSRIPEPCCSSAAMHVLPGGCISQAGRRRHGCLCYSKFAVAPNLAAGKRYFMGRTFKNPGAGGPRLTATRKGGGLETPQQLRSLSVAKRMVEASPLSLQPYLRLMRADRPIGTWLLFWPCTWSIGLATAGGSLPDLKLLCLFGAGSFFMRGAGCVINDLWDKDFDGKVERTKSRPLPSGELSVPQALGLLGALLSVSFSILLQLNWCSVIVGASSLGLVACYPLAKRYTYWPQLILGVTLNWGVLIAWSHMSPALFPVIPLYSACVAYTIIYDTIYSHQDKTDDIMIGVKSTALKFGEKTKYWLSGFAGSMMLGLIGTGVLCEQTLPYYASLVPVGLHLAWQVGTVDINSAEDCWSKFRSNQILGLMLFLGITAGTYFKDSKEPQED